ncbi:glycine-rich domain-containing protein [Algihabitans albus]|uniref:glycine-rich domain-containing protein n=1 Tax=Algihabitans albus TaxID=2164067 RepID=UPI000E5CA7FC|nr:hypothetical protein [Algihabitans albus]
MTVPTETARSGPYVGNGATDTFTYEFRIQQDADLLVTQLDQAGRETALTLGVDYSVTGVDRPEGGDVILVAPLPSGVRLVITRDVPATQEVDLENQGAFFAETIERAFDKLTMLAQQNKESDARTVTLPVASDGVSARLPGAVPDTLIGWNAAGDALENKIPNTAAYLVAPLADLTSAEATQLLSIGSTTISPAQWGYLGAMSAEAGRLRRIVTFTSVGTYNKPSWLRTARIRVWGGGGGGAGGYGVAGSSGSGGGGGCAERLIAADSISASETVTIGAAGSAGSAGSSGGGAGGTSSFGTLCSATGGSGGLYTGADGAAPGNGGSGIAGDDNRPGGEGMNGSGSNSMGIGGNAAMGGGQGGRRNFTGVAATGNSGTAPGGGGASGLTSGGNGGAGAVGRVVVYEYE